MSRPTDEQLAAVLRDPGFPWAWLLRGQGEKAVEVPAAVGHASRMLGDRPDLEAALDSYVSRRGGRRQPLIDPGRRLARLLRPWRRPAPPVDVYLVPATPVVGPLPPAPDT